MSGKLHVTSPAKSYTGWLRLEGSALCSDTSSTLVNRLYASRPETDWLICKGWFFQLRGLYVTRLPAAQHHPSFVWKHAVSQGTTRLKGIFCLLCRCVAQRFLSPAALCRSECLMSRWVIGMKLLQINKQRTERLISSRGKNIYTLWLLIDSDLTCPVTCLGIQWGWTDEVHKHISFCCDEWAAGLSIAGPVNEEHPAGQAVAVL